MKSLFKIALGIGIGIAGYHYYPAAMRYYHDHASKPAAVRHTHADDDALLRDIITCLEDAETPAEKHSREIREWKAEEQRRFDALQSAVKRAEAIDIDGLKAACDQIAK